MAPLLHRAAIKNTGYANYKALYNIHKALYNIHCYTDSTGHFSKHYC